jgi:hypothetical protein
VEKIKHTFVVHGETTAQQTYKDHLYEAGFRDITIPARGDSVKL